MRGGARKGSGSVPEEAIEEEEGEDLPGEMELVLPGGAMVLPPAHGNGSPVGARARCALAGGWKRLVCMRRAQARRRRSGQSWA